MKKNTIITLLILLLLTVIIPDETSTSSNSVITAGEILEYEVSYIGVPLAEIKVVNVGTENLYGRPRHKVKTYINTYSHVPMVDVNAIFESWFDRTYGYSVQFVRNLKLGENNWEYQKVTFDYNRNKIDNKKWVKKKLMHHSTNKFSDGRRFHDPLALFFAARKLVRDRSSTSISTFFDHEPFFTWIKCPGQEENIKVKNVDEPVRTVYMKGRADWSAGYGMKGEVEGWLTDDAAAVPVKGKIDFIIGKITVKLVDWRRKGWIMPTKK